MALDTSGTALEASANANADAGGAYSAAQTNDPNAGGAIASDYANGKAVVDTTYTGSKGDITSMSSNATAILSGLAVLIDPNQSAKSKLAAGALIEAGIGGTALFAIAATAAATSLGLVSATTAIAIAGTIPVVGWIAAGVIAVATAVLIIFQDVVGVAAGQPITWTSEDQVHATLYRLIKSIPNEPLPGAPFTQDSCTLAGLCASYVNAQLADTPRTIALSGQPSGGAWGYQADGVSDVELKIATFLGGSASKRDALLSIVSPLWDARWPGIGGPGTSPQPTDLILNEALPIDPAGGASPMAINPGTYLPEPVTSIPGMDASSYLCELAAAAMLSNQTSIPGRVYAMVYTRLIQISWVYKAAGLDVPAELNAAIGFMLDLAARNNVLVMMAVPPQTIAKRAPSMAATSPITHQDPLTTLAYWVHYYLAEG